MCLLYRESHERLYCEALSKCAACRPAQLLVCPGCLAAPNPSTLSPISEVPLLGILGHSHYAPGESHQTGISVRLSLKETKISQYRVKTKQLGKLNILAPFLPREPQFGAENGIWCFIVVWQRNCTALSVQLFCLGLSTRLARLREGVTSGR